MMMLNLNELWEMQDTYSYYDYDGMNVIRAKYSLSTGKGVCDNYAALLMILTRRIGFDAYVVGGSVNKVGGGTTGHAWVMIKAGGTYYIFEAIEENGEQQLAEVEDEELLDRLAEIFESHFEELYDSENDEEEE